MAKFKTFLIACLAFFVSHNLYSQIQSVSEEEVGFSITKWHYVKYPKSTDVKWSQIVSPDQETLYRANFQFEGKDVVACYNDSGILMTEYIHLESEIPISIMYYLEDEYRKFKIISFVKQQNFMTEDVWYKLQVKTKDEGEHIIELDNNLVPYKTELLTRFN